MIHAIPRGVNRQLLILTGGVLLVAAGSLERNASLTAENERANTFAAPTLPGKSGDRSASLSKAAALKSSSQEAKAQIQRWLDNLYNEEIELSEPAATPEVLAACKNLNAAMIEELLRSPDLRWSPEHRVRVDFGMDFYSSCLAPLQSALLERWGQLDPDAVSRIDVPPRYEGEGNWQAVGAFFKGVASHDGVRAYELLSEWLPAENQCPTGALIGPLFEGWAGSDPEAAWEWLKYIPPTEEGEQEWKAAAQSFFAGLSPKTKWEDFPHKIETMQGEGSFMPGGGEHTLRLELAKRWMQRDPAAALNFYGTPSKSHFLIDPFSAGIQKPASILAGVIAPCLESDPNAGAKLADALAQSSALFKGTHADDVFADIKNNSFWSEEVRERAKAQIRDPEAVERRRAEKDGRSRIEGLRAEF